MLGPMPRLSGLFFLAVALFHACTPPSAVAQTGANVLVVANGASPASGDIARYYAGKRGIPPEQLLNIRTATSDQVTRAEYERSIQQPILRWLAAHGAQD